MRHCLLWSSQLGRSRYIEESRRSSSRNVASAASRNGIKALDLEQSTALQFRGARLSSSFSLLGSRSFCTQLIGGGRYSQSATTWGQHGSPGLMSNGQFSASLSH